MYISFINKRIKIINTYISLLKKFTFNKLDNTNKQQNYTNGHKIQQNRLVISFDMIFAMILMILNRKNFQNLHFFSLHSPLLISND